MYELKIKISVLSIIMESIKYSLCALCLYLVARFNCCHAHAHCILCDVIFY